MNQGKLTVTKSLIIINVLVFVLGLFVQGPMPWNEQEVGSVFIRFWNYSFHDCFQKWEIWRLITYQFVHADVMHILFNMWALYFFGPIVEYVMGGKRFLGFYLICGVAGALFSSLLASLGLFGAPWFWVFVPMIGASAAIYGVMVAVAFMAPSARVSLIFPPISMTMRTFALVVIGIACATILFHWSNAGGEAGHLGGIIMGALIMLIWKQVIRFRRRQ